MRCKSKIRRDIFATTFASAQERIWRDSELLIPNLTRNPLFWLDAGWELELQPLRTAVRCGYLEFNRKVSPRHRAGYEFSVRKRLRPTAGTENFPPQASRRDQLLSLHPTPKSVVATRQQYQLPHVCEGNART